MFSPPFKESRAKIVPLPDAKLEDFLFFLSAIYPMRLEQSSEWAQKFWARPGPGPKIFGPARPGPARSGEDCLLATHLLIGQHN